MRTYVFTVQYKNLFDDDWQPANKILDANNIKEAINKLYEEYKGKQTLYIQNIYSEETITDSQRR
jgi:hypothetical protein